MTQIQEKYLLWASTKGYHHNLSYAGNLLYLSGKSFSALYSTD